MGKPFLGAALAVALASGVAGCSGASDSGSTAPPQLPYTIGGSIGGLTGSGLVLATPGQPDLAVSTDQTAFRFADRVDAGTTYAVRIAASPAGQECGVVNPRGVVGVADVTSVAVWCSAAWTSVAAGSGHTVAVKTDGTLWAWGYNVDGRLGTGDTSPHFLPVQIGSGFASASAGIGHTVALKTDGTLWTWGANGSGQLGDGTTTNQNAPMWVP